MMPEGAVYIAIRCSYQSGETLAIWQERLREFSRGSLSAIAHLSPGFIHRLATAEGIPVGRVISSLHESGMIAITGEEAELFAPEYRSRYAQDVIPIEQWMAIHRAAHILGLKTSAWMTYGVVDRPAEYAGHLDAVRSLHDATGGFFEFVPVALHNRLIETHLTAPTAAQTLRAVSIARIFLDNISHIAAAPALVSTEVAIVALDHGADTIDNTLAVDDVHLEERTMTGYGTLRVLDERADVNFEPVSAARIRTRIEEARWNPKGINSLYEEVTVSEAA